MCILAAKVASGTVLLMCILAAKAAMAVLLICILADMVASATDVPVIPCVSYSSHGSQSRA